MSPTQINGQLLSWAPDIEPQALEQAERTARLPFIDGHVALMPDAHWGMGATVGSVIPTRGAIIPAAVGVDIGCGMIAARIDGLTASGLPADLNHLHSLIARAVPSGVGRQHDDYRQVPEGWQASEVIDSKRLSKACRQMGTLGGGNHFVEICLDENEDVWIVLHSGSRGVGKELAEVHIKRAKGLMKDWFINLEDPDLAYLVEGTPEFDAYIHDMLWAQRYAMQNRETMLEAVSGACAEFFRRPVTLVDTVNCHHNFTQREHHQGRNVWLTRKGAIKADVDDRGVIPGSMGTRSYIVRGNGSKASYKSCSHGAGRRMGRKEARRQLTSESLTELMAGKAWNGARDAEALVDEHPAAYKDIDEVMANQGDLVTIEHTLSQILNLKGTQ